MVDDFEKPRVQDWMTNDEKGLIEKASSYITKASELGIIQGKILQATPFSRGDASVVYKVTKEDGIDVVKMPFAGRSAEADAVFLDQWRSLGVKTPLIKALHSPDDDLPISLLVMEYIDSPVLSDVMKPSEMIKKGVTRELGRIQATMHKAKGTGFGYVAYPKSLTGAYKTFSEEMETYVFSKKTDLLVEKGIITPQEVKASRRSVQLMESDLEFRGSPSLIHNDFRPYNVFATEPLTVFDPNPRITHPYMCLALSVLKATTEGHSEEVDEMLKGYGGVSPIDIDALRAAIVLRSLTTMTTWIKKGKDEKVQKLASLFRSSLG